MNVKKKHIRFSNIFLKLLLSNIHTCENTFTYLVNLYERCIINLKVGSNLLIILRP